jgi:hypothetical protein
MPQDFALVTDRGALWTTMGGEMAVRDERVAGVAGRVGVRGLLVGQI